MACSASRIKKMEDDIHETEDDDLQYAAEVLQSNILDDGER